MDRHTGGNGKAMPGSDSTMVPSGMERFTGMKRTGLARKSSSSSGSLKTDSARDLLRSRYVLCVRNEEYPASLERLKLYRRVADAQSERHGLIRVIDESGEDYLYPLDFFRAIEIPKPVRRILSRTS